jgi:hypothetical protein
VSVAKKMYSSCKHSRGRILFLEVVMPRLPFVTGTAISLLVCLLALGCGRNTQRIYSDKAISFIHATDPYIFLNTDQSQKAEAAREKQESLDEKALIDMWHQIPSLSGGPSIPFVVLSGNFGVDPCSIGVHPDSATGKVDTPPTAKQCIDDVDDKKRSDQVNRLAELLGQSPIPVIYLVAGSNDVPFGGADNAGLAYFNQLIDDVQQKLDAAKKPVQLHNLTRCYINTGIASTCYADIADTPYRLIGFPSYSFQNGSVDRQANISSQEKQFETFHALLDEARKADKKALVVSHLPLIDDPLIIAQDLYGSSPGIERDPNNPQSSWSTWNVSKKLSDEWEEAVASDLVAGVVAGHLHDSHKEIYRSPYLWSTINDHKTGFSKLYLAPALSVKDQDTSPFQARGFALVRLDLDQIQYRVYWYDAKTGTFAPDHASSSNSHRWRRGWLQRAAALLWEIADPSRSLDLMAVLLIALLSAYLTVVQIWHIPEAENPLAAKASGSEPAQKSTGGGAHGGGARPAFEPSPFASNLGKTVIAGLGGLAATTVLQSLDGKPSAADREFYIVWFVILFFFILFVTALLRASGEALRARFAVIYYPLPRDPKPRDPNQAPIVSKAGIGAFWDWLTYWLARLARWLLSLRVPLLTFLDTFVNLIQGKNQTMTRVFSDKIVEQQRNVVSVAETVRRHLNDVIRQRVLHLMPSADDQLLDPLSIRVNISVLSADQTNVFYIAKAPGSAVETFPKRSVAWISVFTGRIRWFLRSYEQSNLLKEITLFDNHNGRIAGDEPKISLASHYQFRYDDYDAFVIFPLPWPQRGFGSDYVKGGIQISFRRESDFTKLWPLGLSDERRKAKIKEARDRATLAADAQIEAASSQAERHCLEEQKKSNVARAVGAAEALPVDPVINEKEFGSEEKLLGEWCCDEQVRTALREAIAVLSELLRGFNENIYMSSGGSDNNLRD